jgi:hypothetical protein
LAFFRIKVFYRKRIKREEEREDNYSPKIKLDYLSDDLQQKKGERQRKNLEDFARWLLGSNSKSF